MSNQNMEPDSRSLVIEAVGRVMEWTARVTQARLCRGVASLATISVIAPLLGLFITMPGIIGSFTGCGGEKSMCMAALAGNLAYAIARCPTGLLVGLMSFWMYRYLCQELDELALEMKSATLELANALCLLPLRKESRNIIPIS
ncbi:MAG: MotA/TolQ/ExbB proton channel family protein [Acidobacteria bacterium]|nr:MotA/TolQ/ExbB proton channel family protein [Acidobacteriota bacterium]